MKLQLISNRLLAALAVAGLILSACAPAATQAPAATEAPAQKAKIQFWSFGSEDQKMPDGSLVGDWYRANLIKPFMAANPDIEVEYAIRGMEAGGTTLFVDTALAAGEQPDVYNDSIFRIAKYAHKSLFLPLDPILTAEKIATFEPGWIPALTRDGHQWGILTTNSFPDALIVNRAIFREAGVENLLPKDPDRDWTTDDFEKACEAISNGAGRFCTLFFAKTPSYDHAMFAWLTTFGCRRFVPGDYSKVIDNNPQCVAGHEWMMSLLDEGLAVPGPAGLVDDDMDAYLLNGSIAVGSGGWYELGLVTAGKADKSLKTEWDPYMVNYPHLPGQDPKENPLANLGGAGYGIFKSGDAAREAAALRFVDYATSPEFVKKQLIAAGGALAGIPLIKGIDIKVLYGDEANPAWILRMAEERGVIDMGYTANNFNVLRAEWAKMRQAAWSGDLSIEEALKVYEAAANAALQAAP